MSTPTDNAPSTLSELKALLKDDTKVKVAGERVCSINADGRVLIDFRQALMVCGWTPSVMLFEVSERSLS